MSETDKIENQEIVNSEEKDDGVKRDKDGRIKLPFAYDAVSVLCTAVIAIMLLFTFVFRFVGVVGPSMQPTLHNGDWLLVTAIKENFQPGDIVISTQPNVFNEPIVKRVIATEGQTVDIDFLTGQVFVDGELLKEDYIAGRTKDSLGFSGHAVVPEGCLFVMGDNREHSTDSRSDAIGFLDKRYIVGKAKYRVSPEFTYFE